MLGVGGLVMNGICENNRNTIQDSSWREISEDLCHKFFYLSDLITRFSSNGLIFHDAFSLPVMVTT